jgi:hypothetical protein
MLKDDREGRLRKGVVALFSIKAGSTPCSILGLYIDNIWIITSLIYIMLSYS